MAYRIIYGEELEISKPAKPNVLRIQIFTAVFLLIFALMVRGIWPEGTRLLQQYLIPGDLTATEQTFVAFVEDLRQGEGFGKALTAFCEEILEHES